MGLSVVSACSRECSTVCDSHGYSWVGHGAGGRSGAPQQPPWLTPIQFDTLHPDRGWNPSFNRSRLLDRHVFNDVEQCSTTALFTARADGSSASPAPQDFCKACLWQVIDASIDLRDPNPN